MKRWLVTALVLALLAGGGALIGLSAGVVPIRASSGHWKITERMLVFAKERAIATQSALLVGEVALGGEPELLRGAGHFETGCRPCHGAPDLPRPQAVPRAMLPPPPELPRVAPEYDDEELFFIVKHGIKFTGMPAWPSQARDDEVRAMVAFLRVLPTLDAAGYHRLVHGEADDRARASEPASSLGDLVAAHGPPRAVVLSCGRCHGVDGDGRGAGAFPKLAGQPREALLNALGAYAEGTRASGIMQPIAASLRAEEMTELAVYFARLPPVSPAVSEPDPAAVARGREIALRGVPDRGVPSCRHCHGPGDRQLPQAPRLAGQYPSLIVQQLDLFAQKVRGGSSYAHLMDEVAPRLTREQMHDVALYYASLPGRER